MDDVTEATEATMKTMEDAEEVTAATVDLAVLEQSKRRFKVALTHYLSYTGRCSKGMRQHGGSTEETTETVEEATAATADSATTWAKGASIRLVAGTSGVLLHAFMLRIFSSILYVEVRVVSVFRA